ncbi:phosphonate utilization associated transcriptional regulator [Paraburkholderia sp. BCC1876]|uniref:phosphonate utilization associated transcriptional regulator n=1 Tax=Paraburkholderia sp. BCC1876 TaxID=2676303 RepID=UPI00158FEB0D|nr:phosphonate utilization associated transcriptional regulator [Paraburkholderia sp. BCC1876]
MIDEPSVGAIQLLKKHSLTTLVQDELERLILSGEFAPGDKLNEAQLATRLGVSRGPVREAFRALEQAGLLRTEKNHGVSVRSLSLKEAEEIYQVRAMLDEHIGRLLAGDISAEHLGALRGIVESMKLAQSSHDGQTYGHLNLQFHDTMAAAVGNRKLLDTYRRLVGELSLFRQAVLTRNVDAIDQSAQEHEDIVEAIAAGDADLTERLIRNHLAHGRERMRQAHQPSN